MFNLESQLKSLNFTTKFYKSKAEIDDYIEGYGYNEDICAGIVLDTTVTDQYKYYLMFNTSGPSQIDDVP